MFNPIRNITRRIIGRRNPASQSDESNDLNGLIDASPTEGAGSVYYDAQQLPGGVNQSYLNELRTTAHVHRDLSEVAQDAAQAKRPTEERQQEMAEAVIATEHQLAGKKRNLDKKILEDAALQKVARGDVVPLRSAYHTAKNALSDAQDRNATQIQTDMEIMWRLLEGRSYVSFVYDGREKGVRMLTVKNDVQRLANANTVLITEDGRSFRPFYEKDVIKWLDPRRFEDTILVQSDPSPAPVQTRLRPGV